MLGLPHHGTFTVVAAECLAPGEDALPHVEDRLRRNDITSAWHVDAERQEGVVSLRTRWGADQLAAEVQEIALGRVGLSAPFTELGGAGTAAHEARLAMAVATPHTRTLARYDDQPVAVLLASAPQAAQWVAQRVLGPVLELSEPERETLIHTARVWLAEDGATSIAAKGLHVHRNTVRYRLRHLEELTGRSLTKPTDLADLYVALECARILGLG
jgi:DNA-binding PucR family transcriptional regulator